MAVNRLISEVRRRAAQRKGHPEGLAAPARLELTTQGFQDPRSTQLELRCHVPPVVTAIGGILLCIDSSALFRLPPIIKFDGLNQIALYQWYYQLD